MSLQVELKKSAVSQKLPLPSDLALGEIALNYNADGPFLTCKDTAGNIRKLNRVWVAATAPSNPTAGDPWLDTSGSTALLRIYDGSAWTVAVNVPLATTSAYGTVRLATSADITNGTAGKIVDAAQLQSKITTELSATPITFQQVQVVGNTTIGGNLAVSSGNVSINSGTAASNLDIARLGAAWTGASPTLGTALFVHNGNNSAGSPAFIQICGGSASSVGIEFGDEASSSAGRIRYEHGSNAMLFNTNGGERLRITSDGKLGLGTSSPSEQLTNTGNFQNTGNAVIGTGSLWTFANSWRGIKISDRHAIQATPAASAIAISSNAAIGASGWEYTVSGESAANYTIAGSNHIFYGAASGTDGSAVTFTESMRITPTGVGIGTTNPSVLFHSAGAVRVGANDTSDARLEIGAGATGNRNAYIDFTGDTTYSDFGLRILRSNTGANAATSLTHRGTGNFIVATNEAAPIVFNTVATERARITSDGKLGLGTSSPVANLDVTGTTATIRAGSALNADGAFLRVCENQFQGGYFKYDGLTNLIHIGSHSAADSDAGNDTNRITIIRDTGNVGVGTTSPSHPLTIAGTNPQIGIPDEAGGTATIGVAQGGGGIGNLIITGIASKNITFNSPTSEFARIDSSGRLLVGTSTARSNFYNASASAGLQIEGTGTNRRISIVGDDATAGSPAVFILGKQRSGGVGGNTVLQSDDWVSSLSFQGNDGAEFVELASVDAYVDGTPGANDMPGRLVFSVTADGASSPTEALRISSNRAITVSDGGNVVLGTTTGTKIGTSTSQKIGFFDETPIVQPTTGIAEAAFVENSGGTAVNVDSTFGGYTIQQVVQALQSLGLLA